MVPDSYIRWFSTCPFSYPETVGLQSTNVFFQYQLGCSLKCIFLRFGELAQSVKCLPCKHKDPNWIPRTYLRKKVNMMFVLQTPMLERKGGTDGGTDRKGGTDRRDPWGSLDSYLAYLPS